MIYLSLFVQTFGAKKLLVDELWSLDSDSLARYEDVYGLFFLFKWQKQKNRNGVTGTDAVAAATPQSSSDNVFFMQQTIPNACGTIALLHVLLNNKELEAGPILSSFKEFVKEFPADIKGHALSQCDEIRVAHNAFARPEPFDVEIVSATEKEDVYHFIAYTAVGSAVFELDGLQSSERYVGQIPPGGKWFDVAIPEINRRIAEYSESEIRFNLLALVKDPVVSLSQNIRGILTTLQGAGEAQTPSVAASAIRIQERLAALTGTGESEADSDAAHSAQFVGLDNQTLLDRASELLEELSRFVKMCCSSLLPSLCQFAQIV
jgi:ubiquitin carboxyl-terminal hydrolase L5